MAFSSKKSKPIKLSPYNLLLTRVRNREEGESFIKEHHDILDDCNVWWEPGHDIYANLHRRLVLAVFQASNTTHDVEIIREIDLATVIEVKAKDYKESFEKVRDELRLEKQAKMEVDQALVVLKGELERVLALKQNVWAKEQEALQKKRSSIYAKRSITTITSPLRTFSSLLMGIPLRYHPKGWSVFRIYEEIKHMDFPPPHDLLDEMSDLEAEQEECDLKGNLTPDAPGESSTPFKGNDVLKKD
ncbi:hypothetical protein C1H46_018205 [Malus baccata]|uniref:Uncharacterized protein n=1 Tax=Malus baccata TaxID=106549 RepID=A0A540MBS0_MALBA|nr:hypothetical protein C1H46_018205 [Malus baccata]